jgi:hypothetical protein
MTRRPHVRFPGGLRTSTLRGAEAEEHLASDLQILRQVSGELDQLETRLNVSPIPDAVTRRGYFTPDEDDRVRQGVLLYRNCRLAAYEIILRYCDYALLEPESCRLRCFLIAYGAALVLYAKSLRVIAFAEHVPELRAKINEPDSKYDMPEGFFEDVLAGYSRLCNYRSMAQADAFWRKHRKQAHALATSLGGDWEWLLGLIRHQRGLVRRRLLHVLWQRLRFDWRAFGQALLSPFRGARHGMEGLLSERLATAELAPADHTLQPEIVAELRSRLKPGDVLLVRSDRRLTAALLPGFWTHAALFLGSPSDLEILGLKSHPHVSRHWDRVSGQPGSTALVIEALAPRVQLNPLEKCIAVDHVVALRPALSESEIAGAIGEAMGQLGKAYDFDFDFNNSSRIVCTELVYRSYHHRGCIDFSLTKRLGRFTLTGDDIVAHTLRGLQGTGAPSGQVFFHPVGVWLRHGDGRQHAEPPSRMLPVLRAIRRGWRPSRQKPPPPTSPGE